MNMNLMQKIISIINLYYTSFSYKLLLSVIKLKRLIFNYYYLELMTIISGYSFHKYKQLASIKPRNEGFIFSEDFFFMLIDFLMILPHPNPYLKSILI